MLVWGEGALKKFAVLLPPPPLYKLYNFNACAAKKIAEDAMMEAAEEIRAKQQGVETGVSGDGTWQKRSYLSLHGIVNVLSMETGKVLDTKIMT